MLSPGKPAAGGGWCATSHRRSIFLILVFVVVLFFCNTNLNNVSTDWYPKIWTSFKNPRPFKIPPFKRHNATESKGNNLSGPNLEPRPGPTPGPTPGLTPGPRPRPSLGPTPEPTLGPASTSSSTSVPFTNSSSPHIPNNPTVNTTTTTTSPKTQPQLTPTPSVRPLAVPYVSPGPYLVEYPYQYNFIINEPKRCEEEKPFVVLVVPVAPHNKQHRKIVRETWGGETLVREKVVKLFFLLGLQTGEGSEGLAEQLQQESDEHHDLIQSDFLDCYKNLTIKTMVMMEWLDSFCSTASFAMKVDSDMFLNVPNLIGLLINAPKTNYMTGLVASGAQVLRDQSSKWFLPWDLFPESNYPPYALGLGYIVTLDLPKKLIEASRHVRALYIEDVYLGLCMRHLGIRPTNPPDWRYFNVNPLFYNRCMFSQLIATTTRPEMDRVSAWKDFKTPGKYC